MGAMPCPVTFATTHGARLRRVSAATADIAPREEPMPVAAVVDPNRPTVGTPGTGASGSGPVGPLAPVTAADRG